MTSSRNLPGNAAVHFDAKKSADTLVSRDQYRVLILLFLIGLPLLLVWVMAWLPRITGGKGHTGPRVLVRERAAKRHRIVSAQSRMLARRYYGCDHLRHSHRNSARQRGSSGDTRHRPVVDDAADLRLRAWVVDSELSATLSTKLMSAIGPKRTSHYRRINFHAAPLTPGTK
jgi:hypothetical protein